MSKTVEYRHYTTSSVPVQPVGTIPMEAEHCDFPPSEKGIVTTQTYTDNTSISTELDADIHGVTMGQQIIDGQAPAVSDHLDKPSR